MKFALNKIIFVMLLHSFFQISAKQNSNQGVWQYIYGDLKEFALESQSPVDESTLFRAACFACGAIASDVVGRGNDGHSDFVVSALAFLYFSIISSYFEGKYFRKKLNITKDFIFTSLYLAAKSDPISLSTSSISPLKMRLS